MKDHRIEGAETAVKGLYVISDRKNALLKAESKRYEVASAINHEMAMDDWECGGAS
ncbi:hypothetical protein [Halobacillus mangrovi]|uniref:hypothetical protein n=1 Tax=Halobacillus mangrovi TaxID=402384 RepID=UPI0012F4B94F|nr:hypothetical protein [Halobacillus mangrovi]